MYLNRKQTAEKLNVGIQRVKTLVKEGKLTDMHAHREGRHNLAIDVREVTALAKQMRELAFATRELKPPPPISRKQPEPVVEGIATRLARIEQKIDQLLQLWK